MLSRNELGRAAVLWRGKLVAYLSLKDVLHAVSLGSSDGQRVKIP
jgi:CBS domain-containing protein